ncbi:MAG: ABC transporter substrate-binding protein [Piscirickettsiaceae bacterium]|nr:ABC transporter substrate-binding protein [Piscirickettsiaceae bacterium]
MRHFWPLLLFVIIALIALFAYPPEKTQSQAVQTSNRIISLAPSITETLFALGLADNVVAVTDYCDYPPQVLTLPKIGGLFNPSLEAIVALQPDLVIISNAQGKIIDQLQQLNIDTLLVNNSSLADIKQAITTIAERTQRQTQAQKLLADIEQTSHIISQKVANLARPRVMIALGHSLGADHVKTAYIAGQHDFYNDLIILAGGINAYQSTLLKIPSISSEGIMQLNPQVIIDIFPEADDHNANINAVLKQWNNLHYIDAVTHHRVHIIEQNYATIPGPRIFLLLKDLAPLIHPELDWSDS